MDIGTSISATPSRVFQEHDKVWFLSLFLSTARYNLISCNLIMKGEKNSWCYPTEMKGTQNSSSSAATWTGGMGPVGGHSSNANAWGSSALYKTLITGSTVTLRTESLTATKSCGLLFPSPLLHTQSSSATPMRSWALWRCSAWASHFRQSWGTGCREQDCLGKDVCSLEGKKVPGKDEAKCDDTNIIRQTLEVFSPFYSSSSPGLIPRGNRRAISPL